MRPSETLSAHRAAVRAIVAAHRGANARIFGSAADGRDGEASDLDILIDPTPDATLLDIGAIRLELRQLLGVEVDVLTPGALPDEFRDAVLASAKPV
jgi:predicted nucleotidyltransferase